MTNYKSINTIPSLDKEDSDGSYTYLILINHTPGSQAASDFNFAKMSFIIICIL